MAPPVIAKTAGALQGNDLPRTLQGYAGVSTFVPVPNFFVLRETGTDVDFFPDSIEVNTDDLNLSPLGTMGGTAGTEPARVTGDLRECAVTSELTTEAGQSGPCRSADVVNLASEDLTTCGHSGVDLESTLELTTCGQKKPRKKTAKKTGKGVMKEQNKLTTRGHKKTRQILGKSKPWVEPHKGSKNTWALRVRWREKVGGKSKRMPPIYASWISDDVYNLMRANKEIYESTKQQILRAYGGERSPETV